MNNNCKSFHSTFTISKLMEGFKGKMWQKGKCTVSQHAPFAQILKEGRISAKEVTNVSENKQQQQLCDTQLCVYVHLLQAALDAQLKICRSAQALEQSWLSCKRDNLSTSAQGRGGEDSHGGAAGESTTKATSVFSHVDIQSFCLHFLFLKISSKPSHVQRFLI